VSGGGGGSRRGGPAPLPEGRRRAYLEAMGIPVWLPRTGDVAASGLGAEGEAVPGAEHAAPPEGGRVSSPARDARTETAVAPSEAGHDADEEPPPFPEELADELGAVQGDETEPEPDGGQPHGRVTAIARMDWDTLREDILGCTACELCNTRTQAVPGVGHRHADLLIIGEAPGQEEDRRGEPFVGRAGQLLDRMLAAIGLDRDAVFITNVLKCRPPKNRDPKPEEARACAPYLRRQIELIQPRIVLSVGRVSAQQLLDTSESIGRLRGRWHAFGPGNTPLLVTYHPAYLLRSPGEKRKAWADLKAVRERLRD